MGKPFNYGGQAVIEGVMMRGQKWMAVAVRNPEGEIVVHSEPLDPRIYGSKINKIPFVRGVTLLWDALVLGMRTLMFSADVAMGEEEVEFSGPVAWTTIALSLLIAVGVFFVGPLLLIRWIQSFTGVGVWIQHAMEGIVRLVIFVGYVWAIGFMPDIKRVFGYHGAEHKAINTYEAGLELTPETVARQSIVHPRCGTAFLLIVMVISIFIFALVGNPPLWVKILSRVVLIPVVAGIAYEFLRFSAKNQTNPVMRLLIAPGLALQGLTTREPDLSMLEVSIASLACLLRKEQGLPGTAKISSIESLPSSQALPADT